MEEVFERYIATKIDGELMQLLQIFAEAKRNALKVVEATNGIVGSFGKSNVAMRATQSSAACTSTAVIAASALRDGCSSVLKHGHVRSDSLR